MCVYGPIFIYLLCSKAWVLRWSQNNWFTASGRATFLSLSSWASQCFWKVARQDQIHQPIKLSKAAVPQETVPPAAGSGAANKEENQHQSAGDTKGLLSKNPASPCLCCRMQSSCMKNNLHLTCLAKIDAQLFWTLTRVKKSVKQLPHVLGSNIAKSGAMNSHCWCGYRIRPSFAEGGGNHCSNNSAFTWGQRCCSWQVVWRPLKYYLYFIFQSWTCCSGCVMLSCPWTHVLILDFTDMCKSPWFHPASPTAAAKYPSMEQNFAEVAVRGGWHPGNCGSCLY